MIGGYPWYYTVIAVTVGAVGVGIFCDSIGQGWLHKLKPQRKPRGKHAMGNLATIVHRPDDQDDWTYTTAELPQITEDVQVLTEKPPVPPVVPPTVEIRIPRS